MQMQMQNHHRETRSDVEFQLTARLCLTNLNGNDAFCLASVSATRDRKCRRRFEPQASTVDRDRGHNHINHICCIQSNKFFFVLSILPWGSLCSLHGAYIRTYFEFVHKIRDRDPFSLLLTR